ncbi:DUF3658 domain-containing protein [Clostridium sporogenes]|uniref:DUF3658 domain-containing protein n=1 Tax=Clostridium sporogenes TaxID=1509 RepID=UPI00311AA373
MDKDKRIDWFKKTVNKDEFYYEDIDELMENYVEFQKEISNVKDTDTIYFGYGQNAIKICGLMYAVELLKDKWENVYFINICHMPMKVKYGIYIPRCTGKIMPEKFSEYIKINRKIDEDEYIKLLKQWKVLKKENSILRIFKDGKVENVDKDYFDIFILKYTQKEFKKSASQRGRDFGVMLSCFAELGYSVEWRVINAAEYGFPQRRKRVFIFAYRNDTVYGNSLVECASQDIINNRGFFC